jgi:hypothetical protein
MISLLRRTSLLSFVLLAAFTQVFSPVSSQAQSNPSYLLMAVSGDVQAGTAGQWRRATTGSRLNANDQLKLGDRSYAAVVFNNTRTFELKTPGVITMSQLSAGLGAARSSTASKYVEYVANRTTSNRLGVNMTNLGAVERSGLSPSPLSPPKNSALSTNSVTFRWRQMVGVKSYVFSLADDEGKPLFRSTTVDTSISLDLSQYNLQPGVEYAWKVANARMAGMPSDEILFNVLSEGRRTEVTNAVAEIKSELGETESAITCLTLAGYYSDQTMNDQAMQQYERAISLAPDVREYRLMYAEFLSGLGMGSYATTVLKAGGITLPKTPVKPSGK